jgi:hypothetical protein
MIITFMYRVKHSPTLYHGKYIGALTDTYEEGLDVELLNTIFPILHATYSINDTSDVTLGILSYHRDKLDYFSENEKDIFDLLYCNWKAQPSEIFVAGKLIRHLS